MDSSLHPTDESGGRRSRIRVVFVLVGDGSFLNSERIERGFFYCWGGIIRKTILIEINANVFTEFGLYGNCL